MSEQYIIKILGVAGHIDSITNVESSTTQYVKSFDPDFRPKGYTQQRTGMLYSTTEVSEAKTFDSQEDAYNYYTQQSNIMPERPDGKPNRPMTAFTVEILPLSELVDV